MGPNLTQTDFLNGAVGFHTTNIDVRQGTARGASLAELRRAFSGKIRTGATGLRGFPLPPHTARVTDRRLRNQLLEVRQPGCRPLAGLKWSRWPDG